MFHPEGEKRITFAEIREHPVFKEHFPTIEQHSRILYKTNKVDRYGSFVQMRRSMINNNLPKKEVKKVIENTAPEVHI